MNALTRLTILTPLLILLGPGACSDRPDANAGAKPLAAMAATTAPTAAHPAMTQAAHPPMPQPSASAEPQAKSGIVKSAQVAGAYTYIETDINGQTFWIATSATRVNPGDKIAWNNHAVMNNFNSKALNRHFDSILFTDRVFTPSTATSSEQNSGAVLQAMTSGGYSYIQVDRNGSDVWLAAPEMIIQKGQTISWTGGASMRNFSSRSLNRTFDNILFVSAVQKHR